MIQTQTPENVFVSTLDNKKGGQELTSATIAADETRPETNAIGNTGHTFKDTFKSDFNNSSSY